MQGRSSYSPVSCYRRGAKSVVWDSRISFSWITYSFSTTYSTFGWSSGWTNLIFGQSLFQRVILMWLNQCHLWSIPLSHQRVTFTKQLNEFHCPSIPLLFRRVKCLLVKFPSRASSELAKQGGIELTSDEHPPSSQIASFDWDSLVEPHLPFDAPF